MSVGAEAAAPVRPPAAAGGEPGVGGLAGTVGAHTFLPNPGARVQVHTLASGCPVLVVDDFYRDPMAVRRAALGSCFDTSLAYYPGLHARIPPAALQPVLQLLPQLLTALGSIACRPDQIDTDFSVVTTPAREMLAQQKHPHVDGNLLAGVVYLNPDYEIGTSFFRHRPTGLALLRTEAERLRHLNWMADNAHRAQPANYAVDEDGVWEHLHSVRGVFNRLVLYPGNAFHSIAMRDVAATLDVASARLTQRFFIHVGRGAPAA